MIESHCELYDLQPIHPKFKKYENMSDHYKRVMSYYFTSLRHPDYKKHDRIYYRVKVENPKTEN